MLISANLHANSAKELEAVFVGCNADDTAAKDAALDALLPLNPTKDPGLAKNFDKIANGLWRVNHAPHIRVLEKLLFTPLDVYYDLENGEMFSYVKYNLFGLEGHLCASGVLLCASTPILCTVDWRRVWADFQKGEPSREEDVEKHWCVSLIQLCVCKPCSSKCVGVSYVYLSKVLCVCVFPVCWAPKSWQGR